MIPFGVYLPNTAFPNSVMKDYGGVNRRRPMSNLGEGRRAVSAETFVPCR